MCSHTQIVVFDPIPTAHASEHYTYTNSLLITDLASDVGTAVEVDGETPMCNTTETAAVSYRLSILADDVAGTEIGYDAYKGGKIMTSSLKYASPCQQYPPGQSCY